MAPSSEQYAQIAAMFTTGIGEDIKTSIELLIPAHLPVQGGLWLVPYAGREASMGRAMLIRMRDETVDIAAIGDGNFSLDGCNSIDLLLERIDSPVQLWIIQPSPNADPTELLHCDADRITLLSGADQAAVVGAYRLLKGFVSTVKDVSVLPLIRIVIVGAEERAASDAASRIVQTAKQQLGVQIEVGPALPAMGSTSNVLAQTTIPRSNSVVDLMSRIRSSEIREETSEPEATQQPQPTLVEESFSFDDRVPETSVEQIMETPVIETKVPEQVCEASTPLASYVQGLLSISPRCPEHEQVELAIDANGCMHVLANAEDLRDANIVCAWANKHRGLIAMACGGLEVNEEVPSVQHLFTDDAVAVADLQGTGLKLHLLAEVEVDGHQGLFSTPLN